MEGGLVDAAFGFDALQEGKVLLVRVLDVFVLLGLLVSDLVQIGSLVQFLDGVFETLKT